jgi:hypothetical protein
LPTAHYVVIAARYSLHAAAIAEIAIIAMRMKRSQCVAAGFPI